MDLSELQVPFLHALVVSVSAGALVGLIRQWSDVHESEASETSAGLRTYALWSLFGFLSAYIHQEHAAFFYPVAFGSFGFILIAAHNLDQLHEEKQERRTLGLTSYAAAILTFIIGSLVYWQKFQAATSVAVLVGILISSKTVIHRWARSLTNEDILSLLQFLAVTGLILPLVPDKGYGPLNAFNPYNIWLMVVLISGLGFVGYVAVRILGTRGGITVTGLAGGLASSTATTLALTRNSRDTPEIAGTLAIGIVIANTVMLGRVPVIILALNQNLFTMILPAMLLMALPTTAFIIWRIFFARTTSEEVDTPEINNPLSLKLAIKFAFLYAIIVFLVKAVGEWGGGSGFYPVAFLSGLTDMDAIALSLTNAESEKSITSVMAARGVVTGAVANSLFKTAFALWLGHKQIRLPILLGMIPMILAGIAAIFII